MVLRDALRKKVFVERVFVWAVLLTVALVQFGAALQLNTKVPRNDDWSLVRSYLKWKHGNVNELVSPFNIHLVPALKIILFGVWDLGGVSLTVTGVLGAAVLVAGVGLGMVLLSSSLLKGRDVYLHATLPLLLMGIAPIDIVTWGTGLGLVIFCAGSFLVLCLIASDLAERSPIAWFGLWLLLCMLPFINTLGIIFSVTVALVLMLRVVLCGRDRPNKRLALGIAVVGTTLILLYTVVASWIIFGEVRGRAAGDSGYVGFNLRAVSTALEIMTSPFGDLGRRLWPISGFGILTFWVATLWLWKRLKDRLSNTQWVGFAAGVLAFLMIAGSVGVARGWQGGFTRYYILYIAPMYFIAYWLWSRGGALGRLVRVAMFATLCGVSLWIQGEGIQKLREYREQEARLLENISRGVPAIGLAAHNGLGAGEAELEALRVLRIPPFAKIRPAPVAITTALAPTEMVWHDVESQEGNVVLTRGERSFLEVVLPNPEHVYALRLEYSHESPRKFLTMRLVALREGGGPVYSRLLRGEVTRSFWRQVHRKRAVQLFWIDCPLESLGLFPDTVPCRFEIHKLEVLTRPRQSEGD